MPVRFARVHTPKLHLKGGGHDNDLVSRGQHDHHERVRGGMGKGGGGRGGHDNDLVSRGQHDHHERVRGGMGKGGGKGGGMITTLWQHDHHERVRGGMGKGGRGGGMITTCFMRAARPPRMGERRDGKGGEAGGHDNDLVSRAQHDRHVEARGTTTREAFHARPQVSCCRFLVQGARS